GTKQAANAWQKHISALFLSLGARKNKKDKCVYMWHEGGSFLFIGTHVDDLFVLYNQDGRKIRDRVLEKIKETMEVAEKGEISFALDMKIERDREKGFLKISQTQYTENFLKEYGMLDGDTKETPYPLTDITEEDLP